MKTTETNTTSKTKGSKAATVIGIILCVVLGLILIVNVTLIIKGLVNKDKVPSIGGYSPMIVLTNSMNPVIKSGDLIIVKTVDAAEIKEGDVISFFDPASGASAVVTHRVLKQNKTKEDGLPSWHNTENLPGIYEENGKLYFRTQGDFNNAWDGDPIPADNLVGRWTGMNIKGAGKVAMFLQTTPGLIICIAVPIALMVGYDLIRKRIADNSKKKDTDALLKEIEELKRAKAEAEARANSGASGQDQGQ